MNTNNANNNANNNQNSNMNNNTENNEILAFDLTEPDFSKMTEEEIKAYNEQRFIDECADFYDDVVNTILTNEYSDRKAFTDAEKASLNDVETPLESSVRESFEKRLNRKFKPGFVKYINGGMVAIDFKDEQEFNQIKAMLAAK